MGRWWPRRPQRAACGGGVTVDVLCRAARCGRGRGRAPPPEAGGVVPPGGRAGGRAGGRFRIPRRGRPRARMEPRGSARPRRAPAVGPGSRLRHAQREEDDEAAHSYCAACPRPVRSAVGWTQLTCPALYPRLCRDDERRLFALSVRSLCDHCMCKRPATPSLHE